MGLKSSGDAAQTKAAITEAHQDDDDEAHEEEHEHHGVDDGQPVDLQTPREEVAVLNHSATVCITDPAGESIMENMQLVSR